MRPATSWIRKSLREKAQAVNEKAHTRPSFCLVCEMRLLPQDLAAHRMRCEGRPQPDKLDLWEAIESSIARGATLDELTRLTRAGAIRSRENEGARLLLVRDVEQWLAAKNLFGEDHGEQYSAIQRRVIDHLAEHENQSIRDIAVAIRRNGSQVKAATLQLLELGAVSAQRKLRTEGRPPTTVYSLVRQS